MNHLSLVLFPVQIREFSYLIDFVNHFFYFFAAFYHSIFDFIKKIILL